MNQNVLSHKDYFLSNHAGMAFKNCTLSNYTNFEVLITNHAREFCYIFYHHISNSRINTTAN